MRFDAAQPPVDLQVVSNRLWQCQTVLSGRSTHIARTSYEWAQQAVTPEEAALLGALQRFARIAWRISLEVRGETTHFNTFPPQLPPPCPPAGLSISLGLQPSGSCGEPAPPMVARVVLGVILPQGHMGNTPGGFAYREHTMLRSGAPRYDMGGEIHPAEDDLCAPLSDLHEAWLWRPRSRWKCVSGTACCIRAAAGRLVTLTDSRR